MKRSSLRLLLLLLIGGACAGGWLGCSLMIDEDVLSGGAGGGARDCPDDQKFCSVGEESACVATDDPEYGCARESCSPCTFAHAAASCNPSSGECFVAACVGSWADCDDREETGCETDLDRDANNCRECGRDCEAVPHAEVACGSARCYVLECNPVLIRADCNGRYDDGCEVDLSSDSAHCGRCGERCEAPQRCVDGACVDD